MKKAPRLSRKSYRNPKPEIDMLRQKNSKLRVKIRNLQVQCETLRLENEALGLRNRELQWSHTNYHAQLSRIYDSKSWKITRPLRNIYKEVERFRSLKRRVGVGLKRYLSRLSTGKVLIFLSQMGFISNSVPHYVNAKNQKFLSDNLGWTDFEKQILSRRHEFQCVYIFELCVEWGIPLYQRPQHMARALADKGCLVIYRTFAHQYDNVKGFREILPNVWLTNSSEVDQIKGAVHSIYSTSNLTINHVNMIKERGGTVVYEYIDKIDDQISGDSSRSERQRILRDSIFSDKDVAIAASSIELRNEVVARRKSQKNIILLQNGVDCYHYSNFRSQRVVNKRLLHKLVKFRSQYKFIVGYFGALAPWLWYEVLNEVAKDRTDIGFVFIGPDYNNSAVNLIRHNNVLTLGAIHYNELLHFANHFDVAIIPFEPGEIARTTSPLKLFEYFALEKPVVVTADMTECSAFKEVLLADSAKSFSQAFDLAYERSFDPEFKQRLKSLALANDWNSRAKNLIEFIG
jgi:hypothetical protein